MLISLASYLPQINIVALMASTPAREILIISKISIAYCGITIRTFLQLQLTAHQILYCSFAVVTGTAGNQENRVSGNHDLLRPSVRPSVCMPGATKGV